MVTQAMIEKISLPTNPVLSGDEFLPVRDDFLHSRLAREGNDCMQVVRHKQAQAAMPEQFLMVEFHGSEHSIARTGPAQLIFARRHAVHSDEKPTAFVHPLWNCMRQLLADRQVHVAEFSGDVRTRANAKR